MLPLARGSSPQALSPHAVCENWSGFWLGFICAALLATHTCSLPSSLPLSHSHSLALLHCVCVALLPVEISYKFHTFLLRLPVSRPLTAKCAQLQASHVARARPGSPSWQKKKRKKGKEKWNKGMRKERTQVAGSRLARALQLICIFGAGTAGGSSRRIRARLFVVVAIVVAAWLGAQLTAGSVCLMAGGRGTLVASARWRP